MKDTQDTQISTIISRIDNIILNDKTCIISNDKRLINVEIIIKTIATSILKITTPLKVNGEINKNDADNIEKFLQSLADSVKNMCLLLDYDGDGIIELIKKDSKNNIVVGEDIEKLLKDTDDIKQVFKGAESPAMSLMVIFSSLIVYFSDPKFKQLKKEINYFRISCVNAHDSFLLIKNIEYNNFIDTDSNSIVKFIIILCVISIPIIELVNKKNNEQNNQEQVITNDMINNSIHDMYGVDLKFILSIIDNLVTVIVKTFILFGLKNKINNCIKRLYCCKK